MKWHLYRWLPIHQEPSPRSDDAFAGRTFGTGYACTKTRSYKTYRGVMQALRRRTAPMSGYVGIWTIGVSTG